MRAKVVVFIVSLILWLGLSWTFEKVSLIAGVAVALFVTSMTWDMFNPRFSMEHLPRRVLWFLYYIPVFLIECVKANLDVAYRVAHPFVPIHPGIIKIKTNLKSELGLTFLANSITLTPGTMSVDVDKENGILYIHWINVKDADVESSSRLIVKRFEDILKRIFE